MNSTVKEILEWIYCILIALVLAMLFRYFIGTPTIVKQVSMYPTLVQDQRLWLNRWGRTTKTLPERGKIITFEEPAKISYTSSEIDLSNPIFLLNLQHKKLGDDPIENISHPFPKRRAGLLSGQGRQRGHRNPHPSRR